MGSVISFIQSVAGVVRTLIGALSSLNAKYGALLKRIAASPGLPRPKPTSPYWLDDPPFPELVDIEDDVPAAADVVIIGSGIAGASSAKSILELTSHLKAPPRVVVLEARQLCSGATGRNGGHIKTTPHEVYGTLKKTLGKERAVEIARFQMRHLDLLVQLGDKYPLGEARRVETVDLFLERDDWEGAAKEVAELRGLMRDLDVEIWEGDEAREKVSDVP